MNNNEMIDGRKINESIFSLAEDQICSDSYICSNVLDNIPNTLQYKFINERRKYLCNIFSTKFKFLILSCMNSLLEAATRTIKSKYGESVNININAQSLYHYSINDEWEFIKYFFVDTEQECLAMQLNIVQNIIPNILVQSFNAIHSDIMRNNHINPIHGLLIAQDVYSLYNNIFGLLNSAFTMLLNDANNIYREAGFIDICIDPKTERVVDVEKNNISIKSHDMRYFKDNIDTF